MTPAQEVAPEAYEAVVLKPNQRTAGEVTTLGDVAVVTDDDPLFRIIRKTGIEPDIFTNRCVFSNPDILPTEDHDTRIEIRGFSHVARHEPGSKQESSRRNGVRHPPHATGQQQC